MKQPITIEHAIDILNQAIQSDPDAMNKLIGTRINCGVTLANHPTIQVMNDDGKYSVGILGLLNGIFGTDNNGNGFIATVFDDQTGELIRFKRMD